MIPTQQQNSGRATPQQVFEQANRQLAMGEFHEAAQHAALLRAHFPNEPTMRALHGLAVGAIGLHALAAPDLRAAVEATERALAERDADSPERPRVLAQLGRLSAQWARSLEALNQPAEADAALIRVLAVDPANPHAVLARAEILAARGEPDAARAAVDQAASAAELPELTAAMAAGAIALARTNTPGEEFRMLAGRVRALTEVVGLDASTQAAALRRAGELFDRAGEHDEAFRAFTRAANLKRGQFDAAAHAKITNAVMEAWTAESMARPKRPATDGSRFVFIVAPPGAGADELARAMTNHPRVASAGPSEVLTVAAARGAGAQGTPHRPMLLKPAQLRGAQLDQVGEIYTTQTMRNAFPPDRDTFVDAGVLHAHLIGLAAMALPGAKFVFLTRDIRANTLGCFFGGSPGHHPYSRELATTAAYLRDIRRLMEHWAGILPGMGHTVVRTSREALASDGGEFGRIMNELALGGSDSGQFKDAASAADHPDRYARRLDGLEGFFGDA